jgi:hypothetical protein
MPNNQTKSEKVERFESFLRTHRVFTEYKRMVNKRDCTCYEQFLKNEDEKRFICSAITGQALNMIGLDGMI